MELFSYETEKYLQMGLCVLAVFYLTVLGIYSFFKDEDNFCCPFILAIFINMLGFIGAWKELYFCALTYAIVNCLELIFLLFMVKSENFCFIILHFVLNLFITINAIFFVVNLGKIA